MNSTCNNVGHEFESAFSRRHFLAAGTCALGCASLLHRATAVMSGEQPGAGGSVGYSRYTELLETIEKRGHKFRVLGYAPDKSPIVAVKTGGTKSPAIFISAGSHSTEHAGVFAAVELIDRLKTEHQVYVIPTRDPIGLNGFRYALGLALGQEPDIHTIEDVEKLLREKGEILLDSDGRLLVVIGEYGYANGSLHRNVEKGAEFLEPLRGRRLWFPSRSTDTPGAAPLQRAYTQIVTPDGEVLHVNRFHDTAWAPAEVRCARNLMAEIQPRLTFDLHEYGGDAFWMSARRQRNDEDELWELRMAKEAAAAVAAGGFRFPDENYSPGSFFEKLEPGVFWLHAGKRGEGLNLVDFAASEYGPGYTIETGMRQPFDTRVAIHKTIVQTAVRVFEERYG